MQKVQQKVQQRDQVTEGEAVRTMQKVQQQKVQQQKVQQGPWSVEREER